MTAQQTLTPQRPIRPVATTGAGQATGKALAFLAVVTLFRLVYGARLGLAEDETYYWQWSRHLALSYYDQGPGVAWLIRLGTLLLGHTPLGVRLGAILLAGATGWLLFLTARRWFDDRVALWALALLTIAPLPAAGSILTTYDAPQVFFWAAALYALTRTLQENRAGGWYVVGVLVGLGGLCKLTSLLFAPCVLLFLLLSPSHRRWLTTPHPYLAFLLALALFAPVVIWNARHGWMGFLHTVTLGNRTRDARPLRWFGDFLVGQAIALGPLLFLAEIRALSRAWGRGRRQRPPQGRRDAYRFVWAFGAPILLICVVISLRSKLEINWPAPTHLAGLLAVAAWFAPAWRRGRSGSRAWIAATIGVSSVLTLIAFFPALLPALGLNVSARQAKKLNQTYGWPEIAAGVQAARSDLEREGKPVFVAGVNYRVNSVLAFYLPDQPETKGLYLNSRRDQYWIWTDPKSLVGQNAVLAFDDRNADAVALARRYFASVEALPPLVVTRPGFSGPAKTWYIFLCRDFKGYDPNRHVAGY